jgi:hypothetical protein
LANAGYSGNTRSHYSALDNSALDNSALDNSALDNSAPNAIIISIMADKPVPKRIYFDTNILWGWPNCSNEIWKILSVASWLKIELYIPKVVEDELEAQFIRGVHQRLSDLDTAVNQYRKLCRNIIETDIDGSSPTDEQLQDEFLFRSDEIKQHYSIKTVPLTTVPLDVVLDMAIHRIAPFEQITIDKNKHIVTGLQDAVIFYSIIEHLPKTDDRHILLSADNIFDHDDVKDLLKKSEVNFERVKSAGTMWKDLRPCMERYSRPVGIRDDAIEAALNADKDILREKIVEFVSASAFDNRLWIRARIRPSHESRNFGS